MSSCDFLIQIITSNTTRGQIISLTTPVHPRDFPWTSLILYKDIPGMSFVETTYILGMSQGHPLAAKKGIQGMSFWYVPGMYQVRKKDIQGHPSTKEQKV